MSNSKHFTKKHGQLAKQTRDDDKGNWEGSLFQHGKHQLHEQNTKKDCPSGSFDHYKIDELMNPTLSREEEILKRKNAGEKISKIENMQLEHYLTKKKSILDNDIKLVDTLGFNAKPTTNEGRVKLLFKVLQYNIDKNNNDMIYSTMNRIKEFNMTPEFMSQFEEIISKANNIIEVGLTFIQFVSKCNKKTKL